MDPTNQPLEIYLFWIQPNTEYISFGSNQPSNWNIFFGSNQPNTIYFRSNQPSNWKIFLLDPTEYWIHFFWIQPTNQLKYFSFGFNQPTLIHFFGSISQPQYFVFKIQPTNQLNSFLLDPINQTTKIHLICNPLQTKYSGETMHTLMHFC